MISRRWLAVTVRRWWGELLVVSAWCALLLLAEYTSRTPQLFAGTAVLVAFLGLVHWLDGVRDGVRGAVREIEREAAAEIALSVQPPRWVSEETRRQVTEVQQRIALAIRGQGAHLREARHG